MSDTKGAQRVVTSLGVLKWATVALWLMGGLGTDLIIASAETWPQWTLLLEVPVTVGAVVAAWLSWTFLGWCQQMLSTNLAAVPVPLEPIEMAPWPIPSSTFTTSSPEVTGWEEPTASGSTNAR